MTFFKRVPKEHDTKTAAKLQSLGHYGLLFAAISSYAGQGLDGHLDFPPRFRGKNFLFFSRLAIFAILFLRPEEKI
jgi:hypothetical protein